MSVTLAGIIEKHASSAPLTVEVCVDGASCVTATITDVNGVIACDSATGAPFESCQFRRDGKDIVIAILLDSTAAAKSSLTLSALVTDGTSAKLFEAEKSTAVESVQPNGDGCDPVCNQGTVSFTL